MYTNNKLSKAVRLAIAFSAASATAFTAQVAAADEEDTVRVERIEVTGSRIRRTDLEQSVPITVIDRDAIDLSGQTSITDVIRGTAFNSAGSFRPQSGNAAQGTSTVSMRGLGASRTLVLIDGRRLPTSPSTGSGQDLNAIPLAAVERIEILSDGASAVYGSDAIGGVINVITRRDFNGVELRIGASEVSLPREGGGREEGSVVFGSSNNTTRMVGGVSWNSRDIIFENAYDWVVPGNSIYGNNYTEANNSQGFRSIPDGCTSQDFILNPAQNNSAVLAPGEDPTVLDTFQQCGYNFNATNANEASTANRGLFVKVEHEINQDWTIFANVNAAKTKSFGRYAPSLNDPGSLLRANSWNNPTNPANIDAGGVYDAAAVDGSRDVPRVDADGNVTSAFPNAGENRDLKYWHRFASIGDRDSYVDNYATDLLVGAQGRVGDIDLDFGVRTSKSKSFDIGYNYLLRSAADTAVNITTEEVAAGMAADPNFVFYDLRDPLGSRYDSNPDQAGAYQQLINGMNVTISRVSQFDQQEAFASAAFDVFEMNAGMAQMVVGAEYRKETYVDQYDALSEAGVVGGSAGNSAGGSRNVKSAYFEALFPILDNLEATLAGRYDNYSDYGSDFSPKVSLRYEPMDALVLRASYGKGFRAPTLDQITMAPSSGNPAVEDPATCLNFGNDFDCSVQVRQLTQANPDLESEQSTQYALGVAYQPTDWFNFAVDYYNIKIEDRIALFGAVQLIALEAAGDPIPAGLGVTRGGNPQAVPAGSPALPILGVNGGYANQGDWETSGLDFNFRTNFDFGQFGRLNQNLQLSYALESKVDGGRNLVGERNPGIPGSMPRSRGTLNNVYAFHDFDFSWNINMIEGQNRYNNLDTQPRLGTWITHDLQVGYSTSWNGKVTIGMLNAFEKKPELISAGGRNYNFNLYDAFGRVSYIRYSQSF
ncbi:TonB-dependent receptor [Alkalimonas collagenimarina]|uniref:TonB-dependent receptor n=1 Tax=Alkalimonas collagenimarina TaxID=400390 RepID=A0ABT9GV74_9GAMM|nr:TonB-dependent receptor [Alkalimonas collagenimarina]MDP4534949.1 TonB-dependent receptor [Alkalimonas collagenimarina]